MTDEDISAGQKTRRTVAIVPHTHWDREWTAPFPASRLALADLLDDLLPRLDHPFLLDGQMAVLDDYLEVRPEAEALVRKRVEDGLLVVGPWYVQADAFQVSGETLARNVEVGLSRARDLGVTPLLVGYLPDAFGHAAQLPQLLRTAGIEHAVVWRGVPSSVQHTAFRWAAPDGSSIRAEYLPVGYGNGAALPMDAEALRRRVAVHDDELRSWWLGDLLLMYGSDRSRPDPRLTDVLEAANAAQDAYRFDAVRLDEYLAAAPGELATLTAVERGQRGEFVADDLVTVEGELRSAARAPLLPGVLSNRVDLKQAAAAAERALERRAEPLAALFLPPERWPGRVLDLAWLDMLRNAAHDSISGCSVDAVGDAVRHRCAEVVQAADAVSASALDCLARSLAQPGAYAVNLSPWPRSGLVEVVEEVPEAAEERRMPGRELSAFLQRRPPGMSEEERRELFARAGADPGGEFTVTVRPVRKRTTLVRVADVPGFGWAPAVHAVPVGPPPVVDLESIGALVDEEDLGDTYTASPGRVLFDTPSSVVTDVIEDAPLRRRVRFTRTYGDEPITTLVETRAGETLVRFTTSVVNRRSGHRLRAVFPLPERADHSEAECAFTIVRRGLAGEGGRYERGASTFPSRRFVRAGGLTVFHEGLLEYELIEGGRALALTLLRSVEWISRPGNPHRPVPAGPEVQAAGPALLGPRTFRYAVQVGECDPYRVADDFLLPLEVVRAPGGGDRPARGQALAVDDGPVVSSVRREHGGLAVRVFNPRPEPRGGLRPWEIATRHFSQ